MAQEWPIWAQNAHFRSFNKVFFVGTLKLYQEMPDIIQSDLIKFDHQSLVKMAEKWPENGLFGPKMAIFEFQQSTLCGYSKVVSGDA